MLCVAPTTSLEAKICVRGCGVDHLPFWNNWGGPQHSARSSLLIVGKSNKVAYLDREIYPDTKTSKAIIVRKHIGH